MFYLLKGDYRVQGLRSWFMASRAGVKYWLVLNGSGGVDIHSSCDMDKNKK